MREYFRGETDLGKIIFWGRQEYRRGRKLLGDIYYDPTKEKNRGTNYKQAVEHMLKVYAQL